ncbi:CMP-N-acetylneuraminic acid synthetase [Metasolibacillus sp.]|uniref:CMP-N-acetylneuraminic acid synthetase n=1 Tax=Metasolibacillus sp. TaxID=2703680 RepID=UPI0025EB452F|nr:CMP-N-acetylneuraminic acid synthetase [Metasolibacillus sp.]MCT6924737.1 CMP-N-acetylneuraminic acid synthetase [Metasolibacillus sp.]MCT6940910.1 CMP-N-acetylneuraminic acid synthetase [Metasolibacillus sp.]
MAKNIAFILEYSEWKGYYPFERAAIMQELLATEHISIFLKGNDTQILEQLNGSPVIFKSYSELPNILKEQHFDLMIYDGNDSTAEQAQLLKAHCDTLVHFDDRGEGATFADGHIVALREESQEMIPPNMLIGNFGFATPNELLQIAFEDKLENDLPHIVIAFEDGDENNLTYRTLRHLTQLHIPLKISVAIDENYRHSVEDLQMMVLSRRHTSIHQQPNALLSLLPNADIVVCNANYTPYKIATVGIPCITAAQNERELTNNLNREHNGFVHLGLGRKMKQSTIQNAVMEFVLHEARRERAIYKQRALDLRTSNEALQQLLLDLAYARHEIIHI